MKTMTRAEAARLLGVSESAQPDQIKAAYEQGIVRYQRIEDDVHPVTQNDFFRLAVAKTILDTPGNVFGAHDDLIPAAPQPVAPVDVQPVAVTPQVAPQPAPQTDVEPIAVTSPVAPQPAPAPMAQPETQIQWVESHPAYLGSRPQPMRPAASVAPVAPAPMADVAQPAAAAPTNAPYVTPLLGRSRPLFRNPRDTYNLITPADEMAAAQQKQTRSDPRHQAIDEIMRVSVMETETRRLNVLNGMAIAMCTLAGSALLVLLGRHGLTRMVDVDVRDVNMVAYPALVVCGLAALVLQDMVRSKRNRIDKLIFRNAAHGH
ncbi:hypothetical protein HDR63_02175 [bacterium]|nr:hypothetical protein [bacterium]